MGYIHALAIIAHSYVPVGRPTVTAAYRRRTAVSRTATRHFGCRPAAANCHCNAMSDKDLRCGKRLTAAREGIRLSLELLLVLRIFCVSQQLAYIFAILRRISTGGN